MRLFLVLFSLVAAQGARAQEVPAQAVPPARLETAPAHVEAPAQPGGAPPLVRAPSEPEAPPPAAARPPLVLRGGERLRVETAVGQRDSGELVRLTPEALSLQAEPEQVMTFLLADVQRLELRKRAPGLGALVGLGAGALAGGLFLGLLCGSIEGDPFIPTCAGGGALIGGTLGAGAGVLLGLAVPRWSTVYEKGEQGPLSLRLKEPEEGSTLARWFSGSGPMGEVGLQLGYARDVGISQPTEGWGGRLHLLALIGPYLALGPEVAWYDHVGSESILVGNGQVLRSERSLFQFGGLVRAGVEVGPTWTALLAGLALYESRQGHAGASVGGEVELRLWERLPPLALDVRYHINIDELQSDPDYLTFGLGSRLRW